MLSKLLSLCFGADHLLNDRHIGLLRKHPNEILLVKEQRKTFDYFFISFEFAFHLLCNDTLGLIFNRSFITLNCFINFATVFLNLVFELVLHFFEDFDVFSLNVIILKLISDRGQFTFAQLQAQLAIQILNDVLALLMTLL